jgi:hypothetical protein
LLGVDTGAGIRISAGLDLFLEFGLMPSSKVLAHEFLVEDAFAFLADSESHGDHLEVHAGDDEDDLAEALGNAGEFLCHRYILTILILIW